MKQQLVRSILLTILVVLILGCNSSSDSSGESTVDWADIKQGDVIKKTDSNTTSNTTSNATSSKTSSTDKKIGGVENVVIDSNTGHGGAGTTLGGRTWGTNDVENEIVADGTAGAGTLAGNPSTGMMQDSAVNPKMYFVPSNKRIFRIINDIGQAGNLDWKAGNLVVGIKVARTKTELDRLENDVLDPRLFLGSALILPHTEFGCTVPSSTPEPLILMPSPSLQSSHVGLMELAVAQSAFMADENYMTKLSSLIKKYGNAQELETFNNCPADVFQRDSSDPEFKRCDALFTSLFDDTLIAMTVSDYESLYLESPCGPLVFSRQNNSFGVGGRGHPLVQRVKYFGSFIDIEFKPGVLDTNSKYMVRVDFGYWTTQTALLGEMAADAGDWEFYGNYSSWADFNSLGRIQRSINDCGGRKIKKQFLIDEITHDENAIIAFKLSRFYKANGDLICQ